jgi:hypothetical protein
VFVHFWADRPEFELVVELVMEVAAAEMVIVVVAAV